MSVNDSSPQRGSTMSHNIEMKADGTGNMLFVGEEPWHFGETHAMRLELAPSLEWVAANFAHRTVGTAPMFLADGREIDGRSAVVRSDGAILATVGTKYALTQDADFCRALQAIEDAGATVETAMYLDEGRRFAVCLKVPNGEAEIVKGDAIKAHFLGAHSHDGTMKHTVGQCATRVVCQNTLSMALGEGLMVSFRHTKNGELAVKGAVEAIAQAQAAFARQCEAFKALAGKQMNEAAFKAFVRELFPAKPPVAKKVRANARKGGDSSPIVIPSSTPPSGTHAVSLLDEIMEVTLNSPAYKGASLVAESFGIRAGEETQEARDPRAWKVLEELFEGGMGSSIPGVRGTAWGAYNAVTEMVSHYQGRTEEARFHNANFGAGAELSSKVLEMLLAR